jgi:hypothetical protein
MAEGRDGSVLAGLRDYGKGKVLFVNLPVTYLAVRTDGLWLHSFMAFFNRQVLHCRACPLCRTALAAWS